MTTRVKQAAQRLGIEPHQLDAMLGRPQGWAWDLFAYEDEAPTAISLADLRDVAHALHVTPAYLVNHDATPGQPIGFMELQAILRRHLETSGLDVAAFGDQVGWALEPFLANPEAAWDWNADGLRDICGGLGIASRDVLAWMERGV